jgi:uncharacterized protein
VLHLLLALSLCAFSVREPARGQGPEIPANDGWVTDRAGWLRPEEERALEALMESYRVGSHEEVALLTVPDLGGRTMEEFGLAVARAWKIGDRETSSGALLVAAQAERELRIEVGRGLEGKLTDSIAGRIIRDVIVPQFKAARYYDGLRDGIVAIHAALGGDYGPLERRRGSDESGKGLAAGFVLLLIVIAILRLKRRSSGYGMRGSSALPWLLASQMGGMGRHGGGRVGGFSGGSFGGFGGGGGFSGGGASGRW